MKPYLVLINESVDGRLVYKGVVCPEFTGEPSPDGPVVAVQAKLPAGLGHAGEEYLRRRVSGDRKQQCRGLHRYFLFLLNRWGYKAGLR